MGFFFRGVYEKEGSVFVVKERNLVEIDFMKFFYYLFLFYGKFFFLVFV